MTRAELDAAFARADIDAHTLVRHPGTLKWTSFGATRGIASDTVSLTSSEIEIVSPRPVMIDTRELSSPLTKAELTVARPPSLLRGLVLLMAVTCSGGVIFADLRVPAARAVVSSAIRHVGALR